LYQTQLLIINTAHIYIVTVFMYSMLWMNHSFLFVQVLRLIQFIFTEPCYKNSHS